MNHCYKPYNNPYDMKVGDIVRAVQLDIIGEIVEITPQLMAKVSLYELWGEVSEVLEICSALEKEFTDYDCPACHDQGCFRCMDQWQLME